MNSLYERYLIQSAIAERLMYETTKRIIQDAEARGCKVEVCMDEILITEPNMEQLREILLDRYEVLTPTVAIQEKVIQQAATNGDADAVRYLRLLHLLDGGGIV